MPYNIHTIIVETTRFYQVLFALSLVYADAVHSFGTPIVGKSTIEVENFPVDQFYQVDEGGFIVLVKLGLRYHSPFNYNLLQRFSTQYSKMYCRV